MKSLRDLLNDWNGTTARINKVIESMPRIIGNEAKRVVRRNFTLQGYDTGQGVVGWQSRNPKTDKAYDRGKTINKFEKQSKYRKNPGTYKGSVFSSQNPILMQSRTLYNGIKYAVIGRDVIIGVDIGLIPYAKMMNEGGRGIPGRQYMPTPEEPPNPRILKAIQKKYEFERNKAMRGFEK